MNGNGCGWLKWGHISEVEERETKKQRDQENRVLDQDPGSTQNSGANSELGKSLWVPPSLLRNGGEGEGGEGSNERQGA